jgi:hypothetical protein
MDVKHLKLDLKNEITEKYKNLYKSKIDKIDESSKLFLYKNLTLNSTTSNVLISKFIFNGYKVNHITII